MIPCRFNIPEMTLIDYMCEEKKEEENLPALKIALTYQYNGLKITYKSAEKDCLQSPKKLTKRGSKERQ